MTGAFDRGLLEALLAADIAALADPAQRDAIGFEEIAYTALERAGLLRRVGEVPASAEAALSDRKTIEAALEFLGDLSLFERLEAYLRSASEAEPAAEGEIEPLESPERLDEAETLFLHRDRVQAAVGEVARRLPETKRARSQLARVFANLARFDERWRENLHEFFSLLPLIERLRPQCNAEKLDRRLFWWWWEIEEAFHRLESGLPALGDLAREAFYEDRCAGGLDDVNWLRVACASGMKFKGRRAFESHLGRCVSCRHAVADLERLFEPARAPAPLRLAAAPTAEALEEARRERVDPFPRPILGTPFSVSIGLKEADRLRLSFHRAGLSEYARELDGGEVVIEGFGRAVVRSGAAEIALPRGTAIEEALAARRTLFFPFPPKDAEGVLGALIAKLGRGPIPLP